jgi:hypothetical protein
VVAEIGRCLEIAGDKSKRAADIVAAQKRGLPGLTVRVVAVAPSRLAFSAEDGRAFWLGIVLAGRQRRRTGRVCPVTQSVRQSDVEISPVMRVSDSVVPRMTTACRGGILGDRRARRCSECDGEHTGRKREAEAQAAPESRAAAPR